jgi:putative transcriptional regulator
MSSILYFYNKNSVMRNQIENRLKILRAEHNITQEVLGKACGLSRQSINAIERGKFIPTVLTALKISMYFGVNVESIFTLNK